MSSDLPPPPPPPLPPRSSKNLSQAPENSPPLPPRNPSLTSKSTLGIALDTVVPISPRASTRDKKKDQFAFGQPSQDSVESKDEYIDYDPTTPGLPEKSDRKSSGTVKNASSYVYPDVSMYPDMGILGKDEDLYVELEDEHVYGSTADVYVSQFENEPLYQWYSKDVMIQNNRLSDHSVSNLSDDEYLEEIDTDSVYEDVERLLEKTNKKPTETSSTTSSTTSVTDAKNKPQRRSIIEDVFKNGGSLHRALWCQMPEVIDSGLLQSLSDQEKKIQEAMFEIMTSEASYQKSLNILINVFVKAPEFSAGNMTDRCVITRRQQQILFSNIGTIRDISSKFLSDLEARWQENCYMNDVCDIIHKHAAKNFEPYVRYCSNQSFQDRGLIEMKQNTEFSEAVKKLEQHPDCQFLPLASFLLLPMQRITRLPLLVDAICHRLDTSSDQHKNAKKALDSLTKVAKRCDEAAKKMQQAEQMALLAQNIEFKVKEFPLISASRFLVKQGELTLVKGETGTTRKLSKLLGSNKEHVHIMLFNDILLVTKKKGNHYHVKDYCARNSLHVEAIDNPEKSRYLASGSASGVPNIMFLALLANHENKQVEMVLSCKTETDRTRWIDAIMPSHSTADNERIYDQWDCPQHQCIAKYLAQQNDELTLEEGDVVNVLRKTADGWYEGERIRDCEKGWFLASHTEEINNSHVRARNLKLRYRLMIASQEYSQIEPVS